MNVKFDIVVMERDDKSCLVTLESEGKRMRVQSSPRSRKPMKQVLDLIPELIQFRIDGLKKFEKSKKS